MALVIQGRDLTGIQAGEWRRHVTMAGHKVGFGPTVRTTLGVVDEVGGTTCVSSNLVDDLSRGDPCGRSESLQDPVFGLRTTTGLERPRVSNLVNDLERPVPDEAARVGQSRSSGLRVGSSPRSRLSHIWRGLINPSSCRSADRA